MRISLLVLAIICCSVVAYFGLLASPDATIHLERSKQIVSERPGDPSALAEAREAVDRAIAIAQRSSQTEVLREALLQRGMILQRLGSFAPALRDFQTVIELDPSRDIQTVFDIVNTLISAGRRFEKLDSFDKAFEFLDAAAASPASPVAQQNGRLAAARAQVHAVRADARIEMQRAVLLKLNDGRDPGLRIRALEALSTELEEGSRAEQLRNRLLELLGAAEELRRQEILSAVEAARDDLRAALRYLEESVADSPRAQSLARLLEISTAARHWERVLDLGALFDSPAGSKTLGVPIDHPFFEVVPYSRARAQLETGRPEQALLTLERFFERYPGVIAREVILQHLDLLALLKKGERLIELVQRIREIPGQMANPRVARAISYYEGLGQAAVGELSAARASLVIFIEQSTPRSEPVRLPAALERLAEICEELDEPEEANRFQERLVPLLENPAPIYAQMARRTFERQLENEEASRLLLRALQADPPLALKWMPLWRNIGSAILDRAGVDLEGAASQAIKSTAMRSYLFDPSVLFLAAERLVETQRALEALPILLNLSQLAPRFAPAQKLRAQASASMLQYSRAINAYLDYLKLIPQDQNAWVELEDLLKHSSDTVSPAEVRSIQFQALRAALPDRGRIELSRRLIRAGQLDRALELATSQDLSPTHKFELFYALGEALAPSRPIEALALLDEIPPSAREVGAARFLALRIALRQEDQAVAHPDRIAERVRTLRGTPNLPLDALTAAVWTLIEKGFGQEALELLDLVPSTSDQRNAVWYRQLGNALVAKRDWRRAEVALDRSLACADAAGMSAACDLFFVLYEQQRFEAARDLVVLVKKLPIALTGEFPLWLAVLTALAGDYDGAGFAAAKFDQLRHPFDAATVAIRQLAKTSTETPPESESPATASAPIPPALLWTQELSHSETLLFLEAVMLHEAEHRATRVRAIVEHLLLRHPRSATLQLLYAETLHDLGQYGAVVPLVQMALALSPDLGPALELLDRTVREVGDETQRWQITSQRLNYLCRKPGADEEAIVRLGDTLLDLGRPTELLAALFELGARADRSPRLLAMSARAWSALKQPERSQRQVRELWLRYDASGQKDELARLVGREYLRALRLAQPVGWSELGTAAPRLASQFPSDVLIQSLAAEIELRNADAKAISGSVDLRANERRRERLKDTLELLMESSRSLFDDGPTSAEDFLAAMKTGDMALYEHLLWSEMAKHPERAELWLAHAEALLALDRQAEVVEEYRLLGTFESSPIALVGRARHLARVQWDEKEAQQILGELEHLQGSVSGEQRDTLLAARTWLLNAMGRGLDALQLLRDLGGDPQASLILREAWIRAAMSSGDPDALREAAKLAVDSNGEPAIGSALTTSALKRVVANLGK